MKTYREIVKNEFKFVDYEVPLYIFERTKGCFTLL